MKLSIVTNAYNQGRFLRRSIESVLRQTGVDIEYIVIDPGSTDETSHILAEYSAMCDPRIIIIQETDKGPADGLNKGFSRASGSWFAYLNADDFYLPGALAAVSRALSRNTDADCVYGDGYVTDTNGRATRRVHSYFSNARECINGRALVLQQSTFYKASSFRRVGGFNIDNHTSWDAEILIDMDLAGMRIVHVPEYWAAFVIHPESITGSQRHAKQSRANRNRVYKAITGKELTNARAKRQKLVGAIHRMMRPKSTFSSAIDILFPQTLPRLADSLPPVELTRGDSR